MAGPPEQRVHPFERPHPQQFSQAVPHPHNSPTPATPKAMGGYAAADNGFAMFNSVRILKEQMLSAFASVTSEGEYVQPPHAKLSYGGVSRNFS